MGRFEVIFKQSVAKDLRQIPKKDVTSIFVPEMERLAKLIAPMLYDPVKTVRIEAASRLSGDMAKLLDNEQKKVFEVILQEYVTAMEYTADFAASRHNLANLYNETDRPEDAGLQY